jgi:S1-C subfamily serine protease/pSer/pThr/pTyr-binding forkhead associated (FHA) protein
VKPQLKILSGVRAGHTVVFSKPSISLGRHPSNDFRFDAEGDLDASARHATVLKKGTEWFVRDQDSKNGTYVNGHRIKGDVKLDDTDQIQCGPNGPTVEVRLVADATPDGVVERAPERPPPTPNAPMRPTSAGGAPRPSTTQRIRIEVGKQTRKLRIVIGVLAVVFVAVAAGLIYQNRKLERRRTEEVAALQAQTDSILAASDGALTALQGQVEGLAARLRASRNEVNRLNGELATAMMEGNSEQVASLRRQLDAATETLQYQQSAAQVDFSTISDQNQRAVAMIWVDFGQNEIYTGTAFAVRSDGVLITNRHVIAGPDGSRTPRRIAVRFADSEQTWYGRVLTYSRDVDLALLRVGIQGGVPTVRGLNTRPDTLQQGDPVAVIGFPLGTELPMDNVARTSFSAGTISKVLPEVLQLDGYGAQGASGSPIFDGNGEVIGILYGGQEGSAGRIVFGVPSQHAVQLLRTIR